MIPVVVALIISIVGLLLYARSADGKTQAVALHAFWVGLLVFLLLWNGHFPH